MYRDYKSGLIAGVVVAGVGTIWLVTRPSLSPEARMRRSAARAASIGSQIDQRPDGPSRETATDHRDAPTAAQSRTPPPGRIDTSGKQALPMRRQPYRAPEPTGPDLTIHEKPTKIETQRFHIVRKDETLSAISQRYYGSPNRWRKILEANQDKIKDANRIIPGTKLIIPK